MFQVCNLIVTVGAAGSVGQARRVRVSRVINYTGLRVDDVTGIRQCSSVTTPSEQRKDLDCTRKFKVVPDGERLGFL